MLHWCTVTASTTIVYIDMHVLTDRGGASAVKQSDSMVQNIIVYRGYLAEVVWVREQWPPSEFTLFIDSLIYVLAPE